MQDETDRKIGHIPEETLGIDLGLILKNLLIPFVSDNNTTRGGDGTDK